MSLKERLKRARDEDEIRHIVRLFRVINKVSDVKYDLRLVRERIRGLGITRFREFCALIRIPEMVPVNPDPADLSLNAVLGGKKNSYWLRLVRSRRHIGFDLFVPVSSPGPIVVLDYHAEPDTSQAILADFTALSVRYEGDRYVISTAEALLRSSEPFLVNFMDCVQGR